MVCNSFVPDMVQSHVGSRVGWGKTPTLRNTSHIVVIKHWFTNEKNLPHPFWGGAKGPGVLGKMPRRVGQIAHTKIVL